jgi:HEAT repeat protein
MKRFGGTVLIGCVATLVSHAAPVWPAAWAQENPYALQIRTEGARAAAGQPEARCTALQNLGLLRAYAAADAIAARLADAAAEVRRTAAASLGLCGGKRQLPALLSALEDEDVWVRQSAAVALVNLTGQEPDFNAFAAESVRRGQIAAWRRIVAAAQSQALRFEGVADAAGSSWQARERAARALGAVGTREDGVPLLEAALAPYGFTHKNAWPDEEALFVQAAVRALGRLGGVDAERALITLLGVKEWTCYAAEALGDCGGPKAVDALLAVFPEHALKDHLLLKSDWPAYSAKDIPALPTMDVPHFPAADRLPRAAYAMLFALSRLEFSAPAQREALRRLTPQIMISIPSDHDASIVYEPEPIQQLAAWLFERAGVRREAVEAVFDAFGQSGPPAKRSGLYDTFRDIGSHNAAELRIRYPVYGANILLALSREPGDALRFGHLLSHANGWVRINAAKALLFLNARDSAPALRQALEEAKPDSDYGFCGVFDYTGARQGQDEFNNPSPRWKESFLIAAGRLSGPEVIPLLSRYARDDRQTLEVQYAAVQALADREEAETAPALQHVAQAHPFESVRRLAREALWRRRVKTEQPPAIVPVAPPADESGAATDPLTAPLVFLKGALKPRNVFQIPYTRQSYSTTDSGPVFRLGHTICRLESQEPGAAVRALTAFTNGYVADLEVSYDGTRLLFSRRGGDDDPWWHVFEMSASGSGLRQLTRGFYHDVHPNYLPDGRIIFSSSRAGLRDEYHGYAATGLAVMQPDGSGITVIGMNFGGDAEPIVGQDGRILFTRLEVIYSRVKTEWNLLSVLPDGTQPLTLYGPESREFWRTRTCVEASAPPRHRVLTFSQPQQMPDGRLLLNSFDGPFIAGPRKHEQTLLFPDERYALTTPYPLSNDALLVAAGERPMTKNKKGLTVRDRVAPVDHGLYRLDLKKGELALLYNDPSSADFEARPLVARKRPPVLPEQVAERSSYTARLDCQSVFRSRDPLVSARARYVRVVEGLPVVARHQTHMNEGTAWKNHGGAVARILGVVPLAPDGSFAVEVPADRLLHVQALDSDWQLLSDQLIWMQLRPGENRGCMGCHEEADGSPQSRGGYVQAATQPPVACLPQEGAMRYRGKIWYKGVVRRHDEERMRTVNSTSLMARE